MKRIWFWLLISSDWIHYNSGRMNSWLENKAYPGVWMDGDHVYDPSTMGPIYLHDNDDDVAILAVIDDQSDVDWESRHARFFGNTEL